MLGFESAFSGERVFITGNTGFKGQWLTLWLHLLGAHIVGYALPDRDSQELQSLPHMTQVFADIRDFATLTSVFQDYHPTLVFHLAAQPLVQRSYADPRYTYDVNVLGTMNVLEAMRAQTGRSIGIMVTSDKCYQNTETLKGYRESDPLGGDDPYSSSKGAAELLIASYRRSFFPLHRYDQHQKVIASVRAGNVIGGGDWSPNRLLPDCIQHLMAHEDILVRHHYAIRPWQHVLEPLGGYLLLASRLMHHPKMFSGAWNFGPEAESQVSVQTVVEKMIALWGEGRWVPVFEEPDSLHETASLRLDTTKATRILSWTPRWDLDTALQKTIDWYRGYDHSNRIALSLQQIHEYSRYPLIGPLNRA